MAGRARERQPRARRPLLCRGVMARLNKHLDELTADLACLREHIATWRTEDGRETAEVPSPPKARGTKPRT